jgi:hypothetical protein
VVRLAAKTSGREMCQPTNLFFASSADDFLVCFNPHAAFPLLRNAVVFSSRAK